MKTLFFVSLLVFIASSIGTFIGSRIAKRAPKNECEHIRGVTKEVVKLLKSKRCKVSKKNL